MDRPETTLFLLMSIDGKISTGDTDTTDIDKDFPVIPGLKEGLQQYYEIEKTTDLFSLITGKVLQKIGVNEKDDIPKKLPVSFVIVDNHGHLNERGVSYMANKSKKLLMVTTNKHHSAFVAQKNHKNIEVLLYKDAVDFTDVFSKLKKAYGADKVTIQSGGTLNAALVRSGLIDRVLLVVAPALIGGKDTPSLMDGESLHSPAELHQIKPLQLLRAEVLKDSYLLLEYQVLNNTPTHMPQFGRDGTG